MSEWLNRLFIFQSRSRTWFTLILSLTHAFIPILSFAIQPYLHMLMVNLILSQLSAFHSFLLRIFIYIHYIQNCNAMDHTSLPSSPMVLNKLIPFSYYFFRILIFFFFSSVCFFHLLTSFFSKLVSGKTREIWYQIPNEAANNESIRGTRCAKITLICLKNS